MPVFNNALAGAAGAGGDAGYKIEKSLRFDGGGYLQRPFQNGNQKKWTWSGWLKRSALGINGRILRANPSGEAGIHFDASDRIQVYHYANGGYTFQVSPTRQYLDTSSWYHIVIAYDSSQSTTADRIKFWCNGLRETDFSISNYPTQGFCSHINEPLTHSLMGSDLKMQGLLTECHFLDGVAITDPDGVFGQYDSKTGVWSPIEYTHTAAVSYSNNNQITLDSGNYYLNDLDGPNAFNGDGDSYIDARLGTGSNSTSNIIWQPTGGIPYVTKIRVHSNYATHYRINNGTWTSFSSSGSYTEIYNGTSFNLTKLEIRRDNCQASDWGHRVTFYEINDVEYQNTGTNSFYLNFSDDSSLETIGDDRTRPDYAKTSGVLTTTTGNGSFYSGNAERAFDGFTSTDVKGGWQTTGDNSNLIWSPPTGAFSVSSSLRVRCGYYSTIYVNGVNKSTSDGNTGAGSWISLNHTGAITQIKFENTTNDNVVRISAIEIDGEIVTHKHFTLTGITGPVTTNGKYLPHTSISEGTASYYNQERGEVIQSFDGKLNTAWDFARNSTANVTGKVEFPGGRTVNSSLELYIGESWSLGAYTYQKFVSINGGTFNEIGTSGTAAGDATTTWRTFAVPNGTLNSIEVRTATTYGGGWGRGFANAIRIDGTVLIDDANQIDVDISTDTPTSYEDNGVIHSNYATLNPNYRQSQTALANGNLQLNWGGTNGHAAYSTLAMESGKYYFEVNSSANSCIGIRNAAVTEGNWPGTDNHGWGYATDGRKVHNQSYSTFGTAHGVCDIIGVAFDADSGKLWFSHNGTWQASGNPATGANPAFTVPSGRYFATVGYWTGTNAANNNVEFGARPFIYTPPTGFGPLCTQTFPDPVIEKSSKHFGTRIWSGDANTSRALTGLDMSPDLIWFKKRNASFSHFLFDSIRGNTKQLKSDSSDGEGTTSNKLISFDSNGFTVGNAGAVNGTGDTYVGWAWNAASSNTDVSVGALNSSIYNDDQTWSGGLAGSGSGGAFASGEGAAKAFDGDLSTRARWTGTADGVLTATLPTAISATTLRVRGHFWKASSTANEDVLISINGGTYVEPVAAGLVSYAETALKSGELFLDCSSLITNNQVSSVSVKRRGSTSTATGLTIYGIEVDGKILVDSNATPPNVPQTATTHRANADAGFSIVTWENPSGSTTVAHGLNGNAPEMIITKSRDSNQNWQVYHHKITNGQKLYLNNTSGQVSSSMWPIYPTPHEFSINDNTADSWLAYCFRSIPGYSLVSDYQSTGGTKFVHCGFKPAFVMVKKVTNSSDSTYEGWIMFDSERGPYNINQKSLFANSDQDEGERGNGNTIPGTFGVDLMSNGFKFRDASTEYNRSSNLQYIFLAIAEAPAKFALAN